MFANSYKQGMIYEDAILVNHKEALQRAAEIGKENVINGTLGVLFHKTTLVTFDTVDRLIPHLDVKGISAYTPQQGLPDFLDAIRYFCFQEYFPSTGVASVAVAGGMGGIRQAIINYTEINDSIIVPDWYWDPYQGIIEDNNRKIETFRFFENQSFDLENFKQKIDDVGKKQENVFIILNTPANNPTGYSLTMEEWDKIISHLNSLDKKIILFLDMAYMDFAPKEEKQVFQKLAHLEANVFTIIDYTISKSLTKYGLRTAALIGLHKNKAVLDEFENIIAISNRGNYGSVNSVGQLLVVELYKNKALLNDYYNELDHWKTVLNKRAEAFTNHINKGIITPYKSGFFVSIKCSSPPDLTEQLKKENIFLVPLKKGARVALCSMEEDELVTTAKTLNKILS